MKTFRHELFPAYKANRIGQMSDRLRPKERNAKPPAPNPELDFFLAIPDELALGVAPGATGIAGVTVEKIGRSLHLRVIGHGRDWVLTQAAQFLRTLARGRAWHPQRPITGLLKCPAHPGHTLSGPLIPGYEKALSIQLASGDPVIIICESSMRSLPLVIGA